MNFVNDEVYSRFREFLDLRNYDNKSETLRVLSLLRKADQEVTLKKAAEADVNLTNAFKEVRKELNVYARKSFSCCGSCGSYELATKCKETGKRGYVFYSRQSKDSLFESGHVYLNFSDCVNESDEATAKLGAEVVKILKRNGVNVEWSGSDADALKVVV